MNLPRYIRVGVSFMKLEGYDYVTRGWSLPVQNIKEAEGKFYIEAFMRHLDGEELHQITEKEYTKDQV